MKEILKSTAKSFLKMGIAFDILAVVTMWIWFVSFLFDFIKPNNNPSIEELRTYYDLRDASIPVLGIICFLYSIVIIVECVNKSRKTEE